MQDARAAAPQGSGPPDNDEVRAQLQDYYGRVLRSSDDLATNACCAQGAPPAWLAGPLARVHEEVVARFYGCGFPIPGALEGAVVLDVGCGTGRDVFIASQLVGPRGFVHGVDMTEAQLEVARSSQDWHMELFGYEKPNVAFHLGAIEDLAALPIEAGSVDVVISNCVVNLSPRKDLVLREVARVLKPGGEFHFSDVFCDRRLPEALAWDPQLHAECLGGASYGPDFLALARGAGFLDPRRLARAPIAIRNAEIERKVGAARFESMTLRLFKLAGLEERCEDYGQLATYRGGLVGEEHLFALDDHHLFEAGRPERVCGNTADMLARTRFAPWFDVQGDHSRHFGLFPCGETLAAQQRAASRGPSSAACC
jgi:SAM-dependent methyltransferase